MNNDYKAKQISINLYANILELRKLVHKGIDVKIDKQIYIDLSQSLLKLANETQEQKRV